MSTRILYLLTAPIEQTSSTSLRDLEITEALAQSTPGPVQVQKWVVGQHTHRALHETLAALAKQPGSLIWISEFSLKYWVHPARALGLPVLLDAYPIRSRTLFYKGISHPKYWNLIFRALRELWAEKRACQAASLVLSSSEVDAHRLTRISGSTPVRALPNTVDTCAFESTRSDSGRSLLFLGRLHLPAYREGLYWFCEEILPRIRGALGSEMPPIVVAGKSPSTLLQEMLKTHGIQVIANPENIEPLLKDAQIVFFPVLQKMGGTRIQILQAMAARKPVVSTGQGAEGLALAPCHDIWIADSPDPFARHIVRLVRDPKVRSETAHNALCTVESRFDRSRLIPLVSALLEEARILNHTTPA